MAVPECCQVVAGLLSFGQRGLSTNPLLQAFGLGMMSSFRTETGHGAKAVQVVDRGESFLLREVPPDH
jgi:hypothetical protein